MGRPQWQLDLIAKELKKNPNDRLFMGIPERWHRDPTWRCENGHISKLFLGSGICLKCNQTVWLTFPEDMIEDTDLPPGASR